MLWACIQLPHLALDAVLRHTDDDGSPLALIDGAPSRRFVHDANVAARRAGVRPGHTLAAAQALQSDLRLVGRDSAAEQQLRELLAAWGYRSSSMVAWEGDDALLIEIGGSLGLLGPWPVLERHWRVELSALGITHHIAVAPTPLGAAVLAAVQDGLAVLDSVQMRRALDGLSVAEVRLAPEVVAKLEGMGLRRLRQVSALPRAALGRRFGADLLDYLDRLLGTVQDPRSLYQPPAVFSERVELNWETVSHEALAFPLRRLLGDLAIFLACRDGGVQRFELVLEHAQGASTTLPVGLLMPERDPARLFEFARGRLERTALPAPVRALGVVVHELPPFVPGAGDLFEVRPTESLPWPALRERLRARLGEQALYQLQPFADARPEYAQRRVAQITHESVVTATSPRPTWLLSQPILLRDRQVRVLAGPERIEAGWWDGGDVRRDYYVIETALGQRAWAFCPAGTQGPWMLHGWFA